MTIKKQGAGVKSVTHERWLLAQQVEKQMWIDGQRREIAAGFRRPLWKYLLRLMAQWTGLRNYSDCAPVGDDWNDWWATNFDGYRMIPASLNNALEIGCGPYTNMRLILRERTVKHAICSDPLARTYIQIPRTHLRHLWQKGIVMVDDHPAEECPFASNYFDLVVMINVLEHVQDACRCLKHAMRVTSPGGYFVLGNDLDRKLDVSDIAHPITVDREWLDNITADGFDRLYYRVLQREECRDPNLQSGTYLFVGRKKGC